LRNLSPRTRESYWWHIQDFASFHNINPEQANVDHLRSYLVSMLQDGNHKPGSVKMGYYALKFMFEKVMHKEWPSEYLPTPKVAKTLPVVLSQDEVLDVLEVIPNFKHRMLIMFIYDTGVRVSEAVNIKLTDIDSKRMQVNIQEGKGLKQRKVPLSKLLLETLRTYIRTEKIRPSYYLFEGQRGYGTHLSTSAVVAICDKARYKTTHIHKRYTPHTFRHCFATHLLEHGVCILVIQRLLGHASLSNTLRYLHVQNITNKQNVNPLERLTQIQTLCAKKK